MLRKSKRSTAKIYILHKTTIQKLQYIQNTYRIQLLTRQYDNLPDSADSDNERNQTNNTRVHLEEGQNVSYLCISSLSDLHTDNLWLLSM